MGKSPANGLLNIAIAVRADEAVGLHAVAAGEGDVGLPEQEATNAMPTTLHNRSSVIGIQTRPDMVWLVAGGDEQKAR